MSPPTGYEFDKWEKFAIATMIGFLLLMIALVASSCQVTVVTDYVGGHCEMSHGWSEPDVWDDDAFSAAADGSSGIVCHRGYVESSGGLNERQMVEWQIWDACDDTDERAEGMQCEVIE